MELIYLPRAMSLNEGKELRVIMLCFYLSILIPVMLILIIVVFGLPASYISVFVLFCFLLLLVSSPVPTTDDDDPHMPYIMCP